jgi:hypothetical protein
MIESDGMSFNLSFHGEGEDLLDDEKRENVTSIWDGDQCYNYDYAAQMPITRSIHTQQLNSSYILFY